MKKRMILPLLLAMFSCSSCIILPGTGILTLYEIIKSIIETDWNGNNNDHYKITKDELISFCDNTTSYSVNNNFNSSFNETGYSENITENSEIMVENNKTFIHKIVTNDYEFTTERILEKMQAVDPNLTENDIVNYFPNYTCYNDGAMNGLWRFSKTVSRSDYYEFTTDSVLHYSKTNGVKQYEVLPLETEVISLRKILCADNFDLLELSKSYCYCDYHLKDENDFSKFISYDGENTLEGYVSLSVYDKVPSYMNLSYTEKQTKISHYENYYFSNVGDTQVNYNKDTYSLK